jgi:spoIIIJ-associated protein
MDSIEVEAKTYAEALKKATMELNAEEQDLDIEVTEVDTKGILGLLGSKKVRLVARLKSVPEETPEDYGTKFLIDLGRHLGLTLSVTVSRPSERILFLIDADDPETLAGKDGEVLEALQHLVRLAIAKKYKQNLKLLLDVNGFREERRKTIIGMAKKLASRVKRERKPIKTKPLNPYERRIIHMLLKDSADVTTSSEGEGHTKKVIISPTRNMNAHR